MGQGRKGKVYTEDQMREAISMYADASTPYSKILEATSVPQFVLDRYLAQNDLERIRRKTIRRAQKHVNGDQVSELILAGKSVKAISEQLHMTVYTVKNNMSEEDWSVYLSTKRRGRTAKVNSMSHDLSVDEKLKNAQKTYKDVQLSFKEIQAAKSVLLKSLKRYISTLESIKDISKG